MTNPLLNDFHGADQNHHIDENWKPVWGEVAQIPQSLY
jgi:hypothetical protein